MLIQKFSKTQLKKGEQKFKQITDKLKAANETVIPGEDVAYLYQCRGFPVDLTADMARERNLHIDQKAFDEAMAKQKKRSKML